MVSLCSLGNFDHRTGGRLVLLTLKIFIQSPSGSTVLFPSAIIEHANTPVQLHETRMYVIYSMDGWRVVSMDRLWVSVEEGLPNTKPYASAVSGDGKWSK